jgi:hypothetical protein
MPGPSFILTQVFATTRRAADGWLRRTADGWLRRTAHVWLRRTAACGLLAAVAASGQARPEIFEPSPGSGGTRDVGGPEISIELDTARARNADKSLSLALLGSAILPGAGQAYLGESRAAKSFLLAEAGFWAGLFISYQMRESYMQSARHQASQYAHDPTGDGRAPCAGQGESCLELMASYRSYTEKAHRQDSYELAQQLSNQPVEDLPYWDFGSSNTPENTARWKEYQSVMRHYRGAKVAMSFAAGALVLNRAAAMAHTLRAYRRTSGKGLGYRFDPEWGPEGSGIRVSVTF